MDRAGAEPQARGRESVRIFSASEKKNLTDHLHGLNTAIDNAIKSVIYYSL